jgi:hypothetical protein
MNAQLNHMMIQQRSAELRRAGERARLATQVSAGRRSLRGQNTVTRPDAEPGRRPTALEVDRAIGGAR